MSDRPQASPSSSLETLLASIARGEKVRGDVVRLLKPSGVMGSLHLMPLTEVLQNMDFGKKSGRVDIWIDDADAQGSVHVHDGNIIAAKAQTPAGSTEGESAILELCRVAGGFFHIMYAREDVDRNVHRPTTFVLLEALRVIDESSAPKSVPAAVDLGFPIAMPKASAAASKDDADADAFLLDELSDPDLPAFMHEDVSASALNDPSTLDIEVDTAATTTTASGSTDLVGLIAQSEFLVAAGDLASARRVLSRAQGLAPANDEVRNKLVNVNEAIDAAQANAFIDQATRGGPHALDLARRATQLRPVRDVLLRSLAVFARGGAFDEVADVAEQLLELDPDDEGALRTLLDANIAMKHYDVAKRALTELLRLHPTDEQLLSAQKKLAALSAK